MPENWQRAEVIGVSTTTYVSVTIVTDSTGAGIGGGGSVAKRAIELGIQEKDLVEVTLTPGGDPKVKDIRKLPKNSGVEAGEGEPAA